MISYIGGKSNISKWIIPHIPNNIETYVEPFGGMFWVFFNMDLTKYPNLKTVVYNDFNSLNTNLFKCVKQYDRLWDEIQKYPIQKYKVYDEDPTPYVELFNKLQKEIYSEDLVITEENSMEIAGKYVYVLTQIFSGSKPEKTKMMFYKGKYRSKVYPFLNKLKNKKWRQMFDKITFIENLDFQSVIEKYDSPTTYFYIDPPYWKTENYYSNHEYDINTHIRLSKTIKNIKGQFSLSYYEFDDLHIWFPKDEYNWEEKEFVKSASNKKIKNKSKELLIWTP
jgi:DNA adenine methylase